MGTITRQSGLIGAKASKADNNYSCVANCQQIVTTTTTAVLRPLYRTTCISRHPQLRTGGFCWSKVLLPHALADGSEHIRIRENTLEFSSVVLPVPSPYHPDLYYNYVFSR